MVTAPPEKHDRTFQFSLAHLMLGMLGVAAYLGIAESLNWNTAFLQIGFFLAERLAEARGHNPDHTAPVRAGLNASSGHSLMIGSILVGLIGSAVPIAVLIDIWQSPMSSGILPVEIGPVFFWCGLGTPLVVGWFCYAAFRLEKRAKDGSRRRMSFFALMILSWLTALVPLLLTTLGAHWVIHARSLTPLP